ncbi:MAG: hypothetical protein RLZZ241_2388 [Bacteroidota bacterium]|jgi:hypothetical protein
MKLFQFDENHYYRPSLLNLAVVFLIGYDNFIYWTAYARGAIYEYGGVALALSMLVAMAGLLGDFILQRLLRNVWVINGIEAVVIAIFVFLYVT